MTFLDGMDKAAKFLEAAGNDMNDAAIKGIKIGLLTGGSAMGGLPTII
ncbi:MAG: hypothetical protein AB3N34_03315 (plasmid) [Lettuce witches'-broom phytoplasma]